jgi:serine/threonine protein kinase
MPDKYLVDRSSRRKLFFDSTGAPRPVVNSKGRRRRVGSKTLQTVLKTDDELFVDFIAKCLAWDPERRLKPDPAMRHPWILAGRARQPVGPLASSGSSCSASMVHAHASQQGAGSSSSNGGSSGGGRLTHGRFNSGTASLHISSPRRRQVHITGSTTGVVSSSHHAAAVSQVPLSATATTTTTTTAPAQAPPAAARNSLGYRTRTQSSSARQSLRNHHAQSASSAANSLPHHPASAKLAGQNPVSTTTTSSSSSSSPPVPAAAANGSLVRQSMPVRAGP